MASLNFQDVIGFYRANNDAVYKDLKAAYLGGKLTPFVGAGLSVFCGYKLWPNVLKELSKLILDAEQKQKALDMIERFEYLEAAEHIQKHYHRMLDRLKLIVSYDKLEACPYEKLYSSAAWVLPYLFHHRPLMTTNFDGVLEYVFSKQGSTFDRVVEPHDPSLLTQIRQRDIHSLFKLHGDIGKETTSLDRLVFTKSQYDTVYCTGGKLIEELKQWYQNQTLLFLGCSLAMDKTMEVLRDVASQNTGIRHFAIVGCDPKKYGELLDRFGDLGIDAIFYDDTDPQNHDAVRVILERLLEETNSDAYQKLGDKLRRFIAPVESDNILLYNAGRIKYIGRNAELEALERFCSSPVTNEWWAVTGPGGMGKSRLIYEFTNQKQKEGWQVLWFSREQYHRLTGLQLPAENTIVVLDDVQAYIQIAGEWLHIMRTHRRSNRLRILLIEREGADYNSADWVRYLRRGSPYADPLAQWCHKKAFLRLNPVIGLQELMPIMNSCAKALGKAINPANLLLPLDRVDDKLRRPLYALAITEAACSGRDPLHWDPKCVLDNILNQELAFHFESLQYLLKEQPTASLQEELELLMAQSYISVNLPLSSVTAETYPYLTRCMERRSPEEFFRCLGLLHMEDEKTFLRMSCPDLIKAHLVLRLVFEQRTLELLPNNWYLDPNRLRFLSELWHNCSDQLKDQTVFCDRLFSVSPPSGQPAQLYGALLCDCTDILHPLAQRAVVALTELYHANTDEKIAECYAKGLVNLSNSQSPEERAVTAEQLKELYKAHPAQDEIIAHYAQGLVNLLHSQSPEDRIITWGRLKSLYLANSDHSELIVCYAKGLAELAYIQELQALYKTNRRNTRIAVLYARSLYNQIRLQPPEGRSITLERLKELYEAHSDHEEIIVCYAKGLFILTRFQPQSVTVERLKEPYKDHPEMIEVAVRYAMSLFTLAHSQSLKDRGITVGLLKELYEDHSDHDEIMLYYAKGLVDLAQIQNPEDQPATVERLKELYEDHSENTGITVRYARGLFILSLRQNASDIPATVSSIAAILQPLPDAIPEFRKTLDTYLSRHPDHTARYQPLLELGGDGHA